MRNWRISTAQKCGDDLRGGAWAGFSSGLRDESPRHDTRRTPRVRSSGAASGRALDTQTREFVRNGNGREGNSPSNNGSWSHLGLQPCFLVGTAGILDRRRDHRRGSFTPTGWSMARRRDWLSLSLRQSRAVAPGCRSRRLRWPAQVHVVAACSRGRPRSIRRNVQGGNERQTEDGREPDWKARHREGNRKVVQELTPRQFQYVAREANRQGVFKVWNTNGDKPKTLVRSPGD